MSETTTHVAPARGQKAGKLFRKEEQGKTHGNQKNKDQPFFSSTLSRKEESADDFVPGIQAQFIRASHLSLKPSLIQPKCDTCDAESMKLQRNPEPDEELQKKCETCEAEEKKEIQKKPDDSPDIAQSSEEKINPKSENQECPACDHDNARVQPGLKVGAPNDPYEKEADRMAEKVMRMPLLSFTGGGGIRPEGNPNRQVQRNEDDSEEIQTKPVPGLQRTAEGGMQTSAGFTSRLKSSDAGSPLSAPVKQSMESAFQADFSPVKIHTGTEAASLSSEIGAQAFAYQNHIYFNENKYNPESSEGKFLLAHELTHTVQQGASKTVQRDAEDEAPKEESFLDKLKKGFESVLQTILPANIFDIYIKIKNVGLLNYIKEILFGLFKTLFNKIGFSDQEIITIIQIFVLLKSHLPTIIEGLSNGDCKPLFAALDLLSQVLGAIAGKVWDRMMEAIEPVRVWLLDIWNTYISPTIDKITAFAGEAWEKIKRFGKWLWDIFYQYVVKPHVDAWEYIAKKLGFGDSSEPGVLGYISDKLGEAWESIKKDLRPVIEPIQDVIEGIKSLVNMEAIHQFQEDAKKWLDEVAKTATAMGSDDDAIANKQPTFREVLLPALNKSIDRLKIVITAAGDWLVEKVSNFAGKVNTFVTGIQNNTYLSPVYSLISWIPKTVDNIRDWATDKVQWVFGKIVEGVEYLRKFIDPIITMLQKIISVVGDLLGHLPDFILGIPFMFLPKCIKDPITKWLTEVILKKIPIIAEFIELTEKWEEIKSAALTVIKQIFVDGQIGKGLWTFFKTLLGLLGIDPKLITQVIAKAAQNFSKIITNPGAFFKNVWQVIKGGFNNFFDKILIYLPAGALKWLFSEVKGAVSVSPPKNYELSSILGYVMDLFGITKENIYKRMELNPRIGPKKVKRIRQLENALTGALEWITAWVIDGPEGLLKKAKEKLSEIKNIVINGIVSWITTKVTAEILKRLATSSDPLGIGATINTIILIYDSIKEAIAYANKILDLANQAMDNLADIIEGNLKVAIEYFEKLLANAVPIVIGFAVEVILGPVGDKIKEIVTDARKVVDDAMDSLINGALDMIDSIVNTAKSAVGAVMGWLGLNKEFIADNGETHHLKFAGSEQHASLMVASDDPEPFTTWIGKVTIENTETKAGKDKLSKKNKAIAKNREIDKVKGKKETETFTAEDKEKQLKQLLDEMSELLGPLFGGKLKDCASESNGLLTFGGLYKGAYGKSMVATGLTKKKMPAGSEPNVNEPETYRIINQRRSGVGTGSYYVLGHLLNHNLGGTGLEMKNLTPLTRSANGTHHSLVESNIKTAVEKGNSVEYKVTAKYSSKSTSGLEKAVDNSQVSDKDEVKRIIREEVNVPTALDCEANYLNPDDNSKTGLIYNKTISNTLDQRPEAYDLVGIKRENIYLNCGDSSLIGKIESPMTSELADKIDRAMQNQKMENKRFDSYNSLIDYKINDKNVFTNSDKQKLIKITSLSYVKLYKT